MHVRWDTVVDRSLWDVDEPPPSTRPFEGAGADGEIRVQVRLFGSLALIGEKRLFEFVLPQPASLHEVFRKLTRELGDEFLPHVFGPDGNKRSYCRLFVDGVAAEELSAPLRVTGHAMQIEVILLIGMEGG